MRHFAPNHLDSREFSPLPSLPAWPRKMSRSKFPHFLVLPMHRYTSCMTTRYHSHHHCGPEPAHPCYALCRKKTGMAPIFLITLPHSVAGPRPGSARTLHSLLPCEISWRTHCLDSAHSKSLTLRPLVVVSPSQQLTTPQKINQEINQRVLTPFIHADIARVVNRRRHCMTVADVTVQMLVQDSGRANRYRSRR